MNIPTILNELREERARLAIAIDALEQYQGKATAAIPLTISTGTVYPFPARDAGKTVSITRKKRVLSPAARRRISDAMKARWAKVHKTQRAAKRAA
jgi:hypothetical protein